MKKKLCKVYVTVGFVYDKENRGSDEFVMELIYQSGQHLYQMVKSEVSRRNPSMDYSTYMEYYLISHEDVTLTKHPFKVE